MKPGIYHDLTYEQYDAIDAVRSTELKPYAVSPRRVKHLKDNPPNGKHFDLGNAVHTTLGEPGLFDERFVVLNTCVAEMGSGKREGEPCGSPAMFINDGRPLCGKHGDAELHGETRKILGPGDMKIIRTLQKAVMDRPDIINITSQPHTSETVLVWDEPDYGVQGKCRIDNLYPVSFGDFKTCSLACLSRHEIERHILKMGYHHSTGWYRRGCRMLGLNVDDVYLLFLQTVQDMDVALKWMHEDVPDQGEREMLGFLAKMAHARDTGHYPGIQTDCTTDTIGIPEWAHDDRQVVFNG